MSAGRSRRSRERSEDDGRGVDEGAQESERGRRRTRKRGTLDSRAYLKIYLNNNVYDNMSNYTEPRCTQTCRTHTYIGIYARVRACERTSVRVGIGGQEGDPRGRGRVVRGRHVFAVAVTL